MVESVERLDAELGAKTLRDLGVLDCGNVPIVKAGSVDNSTAGGSKVANGVCPRAFIEPLLGSFRTVHDLTGNCIRPRGDHRRIDADAVRKEVGAGTEIV